MAKTSAFKFSAPANATAGALRDTYKAAPSAAIAKRLRDAGEAHNKAAGTFFLTVLATYLHAGREDTVKAVREAWADSVDPARQYATNVCRMAHVVETGGMANRLAQYKAISELRADASKLAKAEQDRKKAEAEAKAGKDGVTPTNPEAGVSGTDSPNPATKFRVAAYATLSDTLALLEALAQDAIKAGENKALAADVMRDILKEQGKGILSHVARMRDVQAKAMQDDAPAAKPAKGKATKPATKQAEEKKAASAKRRAARPTAADVAPLPTADAPTEETVPA